MRQHEIGKGSHAYFLEKSQLLEKIAIAKAS
jgi:hypothetical protein